MESNVVNVEELKAMKSGDRLNYLSTLGLAELKYLAQRLGVKLTRRSGRGGERISVVVQIFSSMSKGCGCGGK